MIERHNSLKHWLNLTCPLTSFSLTPIQGDASFRRYFRVASQEGSYIVMDAPPDKEPCLPFIALAKSFKKLGLCVPEIIASDLSQGFLLLSDLGDNTYLNVLSIQNANTLYSQALDALLLLQSCTSVENYSLPFFDEVLMLKELLLFQDWFIVKHLGHSLTSEDHTVLSNTFTTLIHTIKQYPQICVHRDYHSRNLMALASGEVGILDFQDAVWGPISYDLVSLLKDCYKDWPKEQVEQWIEYYFLKACNRHLIKHMSYEEFKNGFEWIGIQRHLKALGIFTRLNYLYHKPNYLKEVPRTFNYIYTAIQSYPQLSAFNEWLTVHVLEKIMPSVHQMTA